MNVCLAAFTERTTVAELGKAVMPRYINASIAKGVVTVIIRGKDAVQTEIQMSAHDWYTFIEESRKHILMQGDPEAYVNEVIRDDWKPKPPPEPVAS